MFLLQTQTMRTKVGKKMSRAEGLKVTSQTNVATRCIQPGRVGTLILLDALLAGRAAVICRLLEIGKQRR